MKLIREVIREEDKFGSCWNNSAEMIARTGVAAEDGKVHKLTIKRENR